MQTPRPKRSSATARPSGPAFSLKARPLLSTNLFTALVQTIKGNTAGIRQTPGTTIARAATGEVVYTPPEGEGLIRDKLRNLEEFIHSDVALDPLLKMALAHYQFEAIHPFADGNGRTGRIVDVLLLVNEGLLDLPVSISASSLSNTESTTTGFCER